MTSVLTEIDKCRGFAGCYGQVTGRINPIVFSVKSGVVRVMVITEQPRGDRLSKDYLKRAFAESRESDVPPRLAMLLGEAFAESVRTEQGPFYWTHFIKCPGDLRKAKKRKLKVGKEVCANHHLHREIAYLEPSLIISVGGEASRWLLSTARETRDWREYFVDQLRKDTSAELTWPSENGQEKKVVRVRAIFLIHPSERSGLGWFFDQQLEGLIQREIQRTLG